MVDISPFKGLIYNNALLKDFSCLISPPYDVISEELRKKLINLSPYNIVRVILPQKENNKNKYQAAKETIHSWMDKKILKTDPKKCFYVFEESFAVGGKKRKLLGFIGLTKIEPYNTLNIVRHEKTLLKPTQDRLNLLKSCRANFGFVYTLYNDTKKELFNILLSINSKKPFIETHAQYDNSLEFKIWQISEEYTIEKIKNLMKDKKLLIADGHHRYETSLIYKNETNKNNSKKKNLKQKPEDYVLTLYADSSQKDILILPTYRLVKLKSYPGSEKIIKILKKYFIIKILDKDYSLISQKLAKSKIKNKISFGIYCKEKKIFLTTLKYDINKIYSDYNNGINLSLKYENLDVNILHNFLIGKLFSAYGIKNIDFTHSAEDVKKNINSKKYDLGIFFNPLTIKKIEELSSKGILLPQKSTFFYPKPCSGLIMYKLDS